MCRVFNKWYGFCKDGALLSCLIGLLPSPPHCKPSCSALGPGMGKIAEHREMGFMGLRERTGLEASS